MENKILGKFILNLRNTNPEERPDVGWGWWIVFVGEGGPYASKTDEKNQLKSQLGTRSKVKYFHQEKHPQHFEQCSTR
jgi:hypothetical protein